MDELILDTQVMDELTAARPKRRSGYTRIKIQREFLFKDIEALERLVGTLLSHLERAIDPNVTDQERVAFQSTINEVRGALA